MNAVKEMGPNVLKNGFLEVEGGHSLYWEEWGNPEAPLILHLHGGPGTGFSDSHKSLYDPEKHHVLFSDQRGSGLSTPFAETANNTTQDLIKDIEKLREHFGAEKLRVVGGSWGCTLSLLYAIEHPERVDRLLLWSAYLIRQFETDFVNEGYPRYFFPEAWNRFIAFVPEEHRTDGDSIMQYYASQINSNDPETARRYADEWTLWEMTLTSINYQPEQLEEEIMGDDKSVAVAKLETHYFLNKCFVPENYILDNIEKIKGIPCDLVHGRFDMCTPPIAAWDLAQAYGENLNLKWVNSGHLRSEPEMFAALRQIAGEKLV